MTVADHIDPAELERLLRIERCAAAVVRYWFVHGTMCDPNANWKEYLLPHELELIDAVSLEGAVVLEAKVLPPSPGGAPPTTAK